MILLFQVPDAVKTVLDHMQLAYRIVDESMLKESLGYLFALPGFEPASEDKLYSFDFDAMIIQDVNDEVLQEMTSRLNDANANVARKAMLTKHNQHWKMGDLLTEINEEHTYFQYYDNIMMLLQKAEQFHPEDYDPALWNAYQKTFIKSYEILQERPENLDVLIQTYKELQDAETALLQSKH